jgi:hypothetical protein
MARVGSYLDADLDTYFDQLETIFDGPMSSALSWLCIDRGVARHFQVAARKLAQHDTFRIIEDEEGVRATNKCPIPDIAIRVGSILSLIGDVGLLGQVDEGYVSSTETDSWCKNELKRLR